MNLSPSQEREVVALRHDWPDTESFVLWAPYGLGRSTMLRAVQQERGGIVLDIIFEAQAILVVHRVVDVRDALVHARLRIRARKPLL